MSGADLFPFRSSGANVSVCVCIYICMYICKPNHVVPDLSLSQDVGKFVFATFRSPADM
jgi:hypothetical protein